MVYLVKFIIIFIADFDNLLFSQNEWYQKNLWMNKFIKILKALL